MCFIHIVSVAIIFIKEFFWISQIHYGPSPETTSDLSNHVIKTKQKFVLGIIKITQFTQNKNLSPGGIPSNYWRGSMLFNYTSKNLLKENVSSTEEKSQANLMDKKMYGFNILKWRGISLGKLCNILLILN